MDNVTVTQVVDAITVVDPTTQVPVTITEDVISVGSGVDQVNIAVAEEVFNIAEETTVVSVADEVVVIQPRVAEVQIQIIEDISVPYAKHTEFVGEDKIYKGRAIPGSIDSDPVWQIWLITITDTDEGDNNEKWADGNAKFDNVWDDYLTLEYS